ncbi:MAG: hypothetical protein N3D15_04705 [Syntrophorhabdaceae bacterium]|nr:hypothetical protein [Syntrophorhabdaceae bacterium]
MVESQFITEKGYTDNEALNELLNMTVERLPQYKWLVQNREKLSKKGDYKIID